VLLMPFADQDQRVAFYLIPLLVAAIALGWWTVRRRRPS
jgi:L-asparagine permease